jgi:hypothetical protein
MFKIKCSCGELLQSQNSLVGKTIRCKNCERAIKIEQASDGATRAVALAPEVSLPEFVREACRAMQGGNFAISDKICLECGAINAVDVRVCSACGQAWGMDGQTADVSMDVTDDARNETEEEADDLSRYVAAPPESAKPRRDESARGADDAVAHAGDFQLVGDDSVGGEAEEESEPAEGRSESEGEGQPKSDAQEGPFDRRPPERRPITRHFKTRPKGGHGFRRRRPFK